MKNQKTITWQTSSGKMVTATAKISSTETRTYRSDGNDGYGAKTERIFDIPAKISIDLYVDGSRINYVAFGPVGTIVELTAEQSAIMPAEYTHRCGTLAMTAGQVEMLEDLETWAKNNPVYIASHAASDATAAIIDAREEFERAMDNPNSDY